MTRSSEHFSRCFLLACLVVLLLAPGALIAQTISGTVEDSTGAVIAAARIEISGTGLSETIVLTSDAVGNFVSPALQPGTYQVTVTHAGFETLTKSVEVKENVQLRLTLEVAKQNVSVSVAGKNNYGNSDPVYRQLRDVGLGDTFRLRPFTLNADVASFEFRSGTMTPIEPVKGMLTGVIFIGEGHLHLKPVLALDAQELRRRAGADEFDEDFTEAVFRFTRNGRMDFLPGYGDKIETPAAARSAFDHWRDHMRERHEEALGLTEYLLKGEAMDNVDAELLAGIYNENHPPFFNAYLHGTKHKDLMFFLRRRVGALRELDSPEEVALINYDPEGMNDGIFYLQHLKSELLQRTATSEEDRRLFATQRYKIETVIAKNGHLISTATIAFKPLIPGERVMKFGLLPNLRVTRVTDEKGSDLYYVQEGRKHDGSFYVILQQAVPAGKEGIISIEYSGDKVLEEAGQGSYYVEARTSWYPNLNGFGEKAVYDLTFKVPKHYRLISVGHLEQESVEGDLAVTHWVTPIPVAVAGFNYGEYQKMDMPDDKNGYQISGYYLRDLPYNLARARALESMAPKGMTDYALRQTRAQLELCTYYFGKIPYDRIYITEQPNFAFGQSWPNLVYLPISAYTDSTQRWMLFGTIDSNFNGFVQEVTPHEVAHQWWGHAVGWASYHDQWLSEGFAEFSAGLFIQQTSGKDWRNQYLEFWERLRKRILDKNNFGIAANDAGPLWLGLRLISPKTARAYQNVTYPKGAYVLQMIRSMMYSQQDGDKAFIDMMHDFVESHRDRAASTESFKAVLEKHMTPTMDLEHNGRMDWFFREWVYGMQVPRYSFEYQLSPADGGKTKLHMTVTQSEVDDRFAMLLPVFADFGKGMVRLGQFGISGNSTKSMDVLLPERPSKVALNAYKDVLER